MSQIINFRDLVTWQRAMELVDTIYEATEDFPQREWFGLAFQMRKSAVSIPSNVAEGSRLRTASYVHHLGIALGSHGELDTQCEVATRRRYLTPREVRRLIELIEEVGRLTRGLRRSLDPQARYLDR